MNPSQHMDPDKLPLVSVVLPTYNRADHLLISIRSVLQQSYDNLELLVVDDGSSDNTAELVKGIDDSRLQYLPLDENRGASVARNLGVREARGQYIAFQDSDDEWLLEKLEKQVAFLETHADVDMVFCSLVRVDPSERIVKIRPRKKLPSDSNAFIRELLKMNFMWTQTWMVRTSVLKNGLLFNPDIRRVQDWDLALNIAKKHRIAHLPEVLAVASVTPGSLLAQEEQRAPDLRIMLETQKELINKNPDIHAQYCRRLTLFVARNENASEMNYWAWKALTLVPWDVRNVLTWFFSLAGKRAFVAVHTVKASIRRLLGKRW